MLRLVLVAGSLGALVACGGDDASMATGDASTGATGDDAGGAASDAPFASDVLAQGDAPAIPSGDVSFTIDLAKGPARQFAPPSGPVKVPDTIYGINGFGSFVAAKTKWGLVRKGGDAWSSYNWTNDYGNSGADYCFWQGKEGSGATGGALTTGGDSIPAAQAKGIPVLATVPIMGYVSAAVDNNTGINNLCPVNASDCNGGTKSSVAVNSGNLDFVSKDANSAAFVAMKPAKGSALCACPGPACGSSCTVPTSGAVYGDEFANWLRVNYGAAPVFLSLDNEPNYWGSTHPEIWQYTGTLPCEDATVAFDDVVSRDVDFATAIKKAWPAATIYGPVVAQDGMIYAHGYSDAHLPQEFLDYWLAQTKAASATFGAPLVDVMDVHYYTSGSSDPAQCVQTPRMFWDPDYTSLSASAADSIDFGWSGPQGYFDKSWYPRKMIPRLLQKIAAAYPSGGGPGLSFSEYNAGCENAIAGGVAEADLLGIFGREGVTAAMAWPLQSLTNNYLVAAYDAYRSYDGSGAIVGDTSVLATTSDGTKATVYAFAHSDDPRAVDVVAINKTTGALTASIAIHDSPTLGKRTAYQLVDGSAKVVAAPAPPATACGAGICAMTLPLPAMSVTTLVLRP